MVATAMTPKAFKGCDKSEFSEESKHRRSETVGLDSLEGAVVGVSKDVRCKGGTVMHSRRIAPL